MRTLIKFSFVFMLLALVAGCKNDKTKAAKTGDAVDTKATPTATAKTYSNTRGTINWTGAKLAYDHKGTLNVESGVFSAEGNKIKSGDFIINMASLKNTDLAGDAEKQGKLEGHLKSADFFDVAQFPKATFSITSVADADTDEANCMITGNLTMKGVSKSVTFPALVVAKADGSLTAVSDKFKINRTDWGIKYSSGLAGAVGDAIISDDITLQISLEAK
ncbi:MAG: YceI family protein [Saprospiraceae bacterium]